MTSISEKNEDTELNMSEDIRHHNNSQNADHERMLTKHDVPDAETEHEKSDTKKALSGDDRLKVDITEIFTVVHPLSDEHKGVLSEKELNAIQKADYVRVVGGWHNSLPRKSGSLDLAISVDRPSKTKVDQLANKKSRQLRKALSQEVAHSRGINSSAQRLCAVSKN